MSTRTPDAAAPESGLPSAVFRVTRIDPASRIAPPSGFAAAPRPGRVAVARPPVAPGAPVGVAVGGAPVGFALESATGSSLVERVRSRPSRRYATTPTTAIA